jgi:hypothetical protein
MIKVSVHDFQREIDCIYDDEQYSVRDNGAVLRHPRTGKRPRPTDDKWTFGKPNSKNGYMYISQKRIHRIVATAFHGAPPTSEHIVDHIDTNRQNNRPENLRWLTRLENALNNPITRKRIEFLCGSIEAYLENPSMLNGLQGDPNLKWMRTVTPEEAKNCMARMSFWANSNNKPKRTTVTVNRKSSFGERAYKPLQKWEVGLAGEPGLELALTPWCAQYMWRAPAYFPCCPQDLGADPLDDYFENIKPGDVFAYSENDDAFPKLSALESKNLAEKSSIIVMAKRADRKWLIVGVEQDKKSKHFIHFGLGLYSSKGEADKAFHAKNVSTDFWSEGYSNIYN